MFVTVYKHTNRETGAGYVGITSKTLAVRWQEHVADAMLGSHLPFHAAIRELGPEAFDHTILEMHTDVLTARYREMELIREHRTLHWNPKHKGYNCTLGGEWRGEHLKLTKHQRKVFKKTGRIPPLEPERKPKMRKCRQVVQLKPQIPPGWQPRDRKEHEPVAFGVVKSRRRLSSESRV